MCLFSQRGVLQFRSPAIKDGIATLITTNGHIFAFNIENGEVIWDINKNGKGYTNTVIVDNIVYVGCGDNHLYALDLKTGRELWNYESDNPVHTPFIDNGVVYFMSGNYFYAIK
ncbi:PQQ-binding-like beta-propeller repeat protein [Bacteroidota bacterium]